MFILSTFEYGDLRNAVIFLIMIFFAISLKKNKKFFKYYFLITSAENLSTYYNHGLLQLENTKTAINTSRNSAKTFKFLKSPRGENYLWAPLDETATTE